MKNTLDFSHVSDKAGDSRKKEVRKMFASIILF